MQTDDCTNSKHPLLSSTLQDGGADSDTNSHCALILEESTPPAQHHATSASAAAAAAAGGNREKSNGNNNYEMREFNRRMLFSNGSGNSATTSNNPNASGATTTTPTTTIAATGTTTSQQQLQQVGRRQTWLWTLLRHGSSCFRRTSDGRRRRRRRTRQEQQQQQQEAYKWLAAPASRWQPSIQGKDHYVYARDAMTTTSATCATRPLDSIWKVRSLSLSLTHSLSPFLSLSLLYIYFLILLFFRASERVKRTATLKESASSHHALYIYIIHTTDIYRHKFIIISIYITYNSALQEKCEKTMTINCAKRRTPIYYIVNANALYKYINILYILYTALFRLFRCRNTNIYIYTTRWEYVAYCISR